MYKNKIIISVLALIGIILTVMAFIPYKKDLNCADSNCDGEFIPTGSICNLDKNNKKKCYVSKHRYYLIIPAIVFLGVSAIKYYYEIYKLQTPEQEINSVDMTEEDFLDDLYK